MRLLITLAVIFVQLNIQAQRASLRGQIQEAEGAPAEFANGLNVRLSANDIFYETGWDGQSTFDGLTAIGSGRWDSRRASLSLSYRFGNEKVKTTMRKTGLEEEAGRVGGE